MRALTRRLKRLEAKLPPPDPELERALERCAVTFDRWDRLVAAAWPLMSPDEQALVYQGVTKLQEANAGPYELWFGGLVLGFSRLPLLAPEVARDLLVVRACNQVAGNFVCTGCELAYPFRAWPRDGEATWWVGPPPPTLPEFFAACPHCGGTAREIAGDDVVEQTDYPWKHLDGYVAPLPPTTPQHRR